jgi:thioredoxin-like negative regulator of GroEL
MPPECLSLLQDQDHMSFLLAKVDQTGMSILTQKFNIAPFPTIILFRGGKEIDRIEFNVSADRASNNRIVECLV